MTLACYFTEKNAAMSQIMKWILVANASASLIFSLIAVLGNVCCSQQKQQLETKCSKTLKYVCICYNFRLAYYFSIPTAGLEFLHGLGLLIMTTGGLAEFSAYFDQYVMLRQTVDFQMAFAVYSAIYIAFTGMWMKFAMYAGQQSTGDKEIVYQTQNTTIRGVVGSQDGFGAHA